MKMLMLTQNRWLLATAATLLLVTTPALAEAPLVEAETVRQDNVTRLRLLNEWQGCDLQGAILSEAHLIGADLRDAHLYYVDVAGASMENLNLAGAQLLHTPIYVGGEESPLEETLPLEPVIPFEETLPPTEMLLLPELEPGLYK